MKRTLRKNIMIVFCCAFICMLNVSICKAEEQDIVNYEEETIKVTDIEIEGYQEELMVDETMSLTATVLPNDATDTMVTYKSSDEKIATVKSSGTVSGIAPGKAVIYVICGDIKKELPITVKVKTKAIEVNSQYIVMQVGEDYTLKAAVVPDTAEGKLTYKSMEESIAKVSDDGVISGKACGTTSILISNGYSQTTATVVVNESIIDSEQIGESVVVPLDSQEYPELVNTKDYKIITSDMLKYYYENKKDFTIKNEKYNINVASADIVNYDNELHTDLKFDFVADGILIEIDKNLCGKITLDISQMITNEKYLYMYNDDRQRYEQIDVDNVNTIAIETLGKYLVSSKDLSKEQINIVMIVCGVGMVLIGVMVYIIAKKRYWFW